MFTQSLKALIESSLTIPTSNTCVKPKDQAILNTLSIVSFLSFCGMHYRFLRHAFFFFFNSFITRFWKHHIFFHPPLLCSKALNSPCSMVSTRMPTCLSPLISFKRFLMISVLSPPLRKPDNKQKLFMGVGRPGGGHSFSMTAFLPSS